MPYSFSHLSNEETGYFSRLVTDYLTGKPEIQPFFTFGWDSKGLEQAIQARANHPVNRGVLTSVLTKQYSTLEVHPKVATNLALLANENTLTICTAHQPNLLTGYLYFVYKILHAIKMADELNTQYTDKKFVPVYYMGSEDNDIEELGVFRFRGTKYVWDGSGQAGAVGRMSTVGLKSMLADVFKLFGPPGKDCDQLLKIFTEAYFKHKTIGAATQYLVNELFGRFGLIVLDPDDAALKALFIPVMEDELLHQHAQPIIAKQIEQLGAHYKIQAHPRDINLFYLADQLRERIEKKGDKWVVVNTTIEWTKEEILTELNQHPERFSPNVMLRGLFQETILPDVAFIGGGAEVAYWMQLKTLFEYYKGFFPAIYLRQSVMVMDKEANRLQQQLQLSIQEVFLEEDALARLYVSRHGSDNWQTADDEAAVEALMRNIKEKAVTVDASLAAATEAALKKIKHQLDVLEKKMLRAEKRKMEVQMLRIEKLKAALFPNGGLQERVNNFSEYYLEHGASFFDAVLEGIHPLSGHFLVVHTN